MDDENRGGGINDPVLEKERGKAKVLCKNCKQRVEPVNMVCPECGHYINEDRVVYQSVDPKTARKIRWIISVVLVVVFVLLCAFGVIKLRACEDSESLVHIGRNFAMRVSGVFQRVK